MKITFCKRETGEIFEEKVYGKFFLELLYSKYWVLKGLSFFLLPLITRFSFFSKLYALCQKTALSRRKIAPFIAKFNIDTTEFKHPIREFRSFNDFFIRPLKPSSRPLALGDDVATLPADGRYLVFPSLDQSKGFYVKGQTFNVSQLLRNPALATRYETGSLVIGRLCPVDCHRFYFPCDCTPSETRSLKGPLYSVNPIALRDRLAILTENDRVMTELNTRAFGKVLFIEVGATFVGAIKQSYSPQTPYCKGDEKGYFEFGGSCILLLFERGRIAFDKDLLDASSSHIEMCAKMGQSLGKAL